MSRKQQKTLYRIFASAVLLVAAALLPLEGFPRLLAFLLPYLLVGWDVLWRAVRNILKGQIFDENFLMSIATVGAFALAEYPEAVFVMLFYQVGELFQSYAVGKSRKSITQLMDIRPDYANVEQAGNLIQVDPDEVAVGDLIVVKPGEKVPLDGIVMEGASALNTSALTGESVPRDVAAGDDVISGCINQSGLLRVSVTKTFGESTVSKILDLVENAGNKKAKAEAFITRFAKYYTPVVVIAAVVLAVLPPLFFAQQWSVWVERALNFLVISCPCALVMSIPLSFFGGIGGASRQGILVKGANYLEALAQVETVVFDKTGTLTKGVFKVTNIHAEGFSKEQLLEYAALAEHYSPHPISMSLQAAYGKKADTSRIAEYTDIPGQGVTARIDHINVSAGNDKLMDSINAKWRQCRKTGTIVHVAVNGVYAGHIIIEDELKAESKEAVLRLRRDGVRTVAMLTGDTDEVGRSVANELGIDIVFTQLLPDEKVGRVEALLAQKRRGKTLAFVGDGMNDAPVLSRADLGVAMGAMGSDAAIEAADIVLMDDNPLKIATAMRISRKTLRIVKQNTVFSLAVKIGVMALSAVGFINMWAAIFADVGVMILAVINASRSLKSK